MEMLQKIFPLSFKKAGSVADLIIGIILYVIIGALAGALIALAGLLTVWIPLVGLLIGWVLGIISTIVEIWVVAGIVILVLAFLKVLK